MADPGVREAELTAIRVRLRQQPVVGVVGTAGGLAIEVGVSQNVAVGVVRKALGLNERQ